MRTGEKARQVWVASYSKDDAFSYPLYIAADNYQQAANFAMTRNAQGYMHRICGVVCYSTTVPIELPFEAAWLNQQKNK